jgi:nickel-dependent lactate racemase
MHVRSVELPTLLWYGDKKLPLDFPSDWDVQLYKMNGDKLPPLDEDDIKTVLANPIGTKRIGELAKGRKEAAIVIDDMTRATKPSLLLPYILKELNDNGISDDHIRFIMAIGAHAAQNRMDFAKKLGEEIVEEFPVWNHNVTGNVEYLGDTSNGTPVEINGEFMSCDLRIAIGGIVPHPMAGFGGGSKIIVPGISSLKTINYNHVNVYLSGPNHTAHPSTGWGKTDDNVLVKDNEEIAKMSGLDIKIDLVFNGRAQPVGLFMGNVIDEYREGVKLGRKVYATETPGDFDIVVANNYFKSNEASLATAIAVDSVRKGGTVVLVSIAPDGQIAHYTVGKWGRDAGGPLYQKRGTQTPPKLGKLIVYSPYKQKDPCLPIGDPDETIWLKDWREVLEELKNTHKGKTRVAVYPNAEVQRPVKPKSA